MPELPEIETIVRGLAPVLRARRIAKVAVRDRRLRTLLAADFATSLTGRRIVDIRRHGKFMLLVLDDGRCWLVHLGMSGRLTLARPGRPDMPHDHVVVHLADGRLLTYNDPRRFGRLAVIAGDAVAAETVPGLDALSDRFTAAFLYARSRRHRRTTVKALLMDQLRERDPVPRGGAAATPRRPSDARRMCAARDGDGRGARRGHRARRLVDLGLP
jgi:formamidopyrimidine-DNA glycosylase